MTMWAFYVHEAYINALADGARRADRAAAQPGRDRPRARHEQVRPGRSRRRCGSTTRRGPRTGATCRTPSDEALHLAKRDEADHRAGPLSVRRARRRACRLLGVAPQPQPRPQKAADKRPAASAWRCREAAGHHGRLGGIYEIRMALMGVLPEHRNAWARRAAHPPDHRQRTRRDGYEAAELSWVLDSQQAARRTRSTSWAARATRSTPCSRRRCRRRRRPRWRLRFVGDSSSVSRRRRCARQTPPFYRTSLRWLRLPFGVSMRSNCPPCQGGQSARRRRRRRDGICRWQRQRLWGSARGVAALDHGGTYDPIADGVATTARSGGAGARRGRRAARGTS